jgi:hypothetical protein
MFAFLASLVFAVALILHLIGHGTAPLVTDFVLAGFLCVALHLAGFGERVVGWVRRPARTAA